MLFTLEALPARHGDALLLHCGETSNPDRYIIDGGWKNVYINDLKPRLEKLRGTKTTLPIRLVMMSHVDEDHITGIVDLTAELRDQMQNHTPLSYKIQSVWHNSFDDILGNGAKTLSQAGTSVLQAASATAVAGLDIPLHEEAAIRLAGIAQGRTLRDDAKFLGCSVNKPSDQGLIVTSNASIEITPGVKIRIVGPGPDQIEDLRKEWDKYLKQKGLGVSTAGVELAQYLDDSAANLSSIVAHIQCQDKEVLLTGDARGDFILEGMEKTGLLLPGGSRHLTVLKAPHHGSDRNVEIEFFKRLPADHYVFSADGEYGNPDLPTFTMLFKARAADSKPFTIHLTYDPGSYREDSKKHVAYPLAKLRALFKAQEAAGRKFKVNFPKTTGGFIRIDMLDAYPGP
jgi:hypothetical protein